MNEIVKYLQEPKLVRFAMIGALGCLAGAIIGEFFLWMTNVAPPPPVRHTTALVIDTSGSMSGSKFSEVKEAAKGFVARQKDLGRDETAVIRFDSDASVAAKATSKWDVLDKAIDSLSIGGSTNIADGLAKAQNEFPLRQTGKEPKKNNEVNQCGILLFTDGAADNPSLAITNAKQAREAGAKIVAIGTEDADFHFLEKVTGDPKLVFKTTDGSFAESFRAAEVVLRSGSLVETSNSNGSTIGGIVRPACWTSLLAIGIAIALTVSQNLYMRRQPIGSKELALAVGGGMLGGLIGGALGQIVYSIPLSLVSNGILGAIFGFIGRCIGWGLLGGFVGIVTAFMVPNLPRKRAFIGGAIGGLVGALAFSFLSFGSDLLARWVGASILGAAIGIMIAFMEAVSRVYWLEVAYGPREKFRVNLGETPIRIGSGPNCAVRIQGIEETVGVYRLSEGKLQYADAGSNVTKQLAADDRRSFGNVTIQVHGIDLQGNSPSPIDPDPIAKPKLPPPAKRILKTGE